MKVNANTIRVGHILEHQGSLWAVQKTAIVQPGKGGAFIQIEMKDLHSGTKTVERFRTQETVVRARLDEQQMQFLYVQDSQYTFMNTGDFEQITLSRDQIGRSAIWLQDGMMITINSHEGTPISVDLPSSVILAVVETAPALKHQTASASYKPAVLENGERVSVPPHVEISDRVVISTSDGSYLERAKG